MVFWRCAPHVLTCERCHFFTREFQRAHLPTPQLHFHFQTQVCNTPELCAEATLQPLRRFANLDAVVIFSDILIIPQAMGMEVLMAPGPVFPSPLKSPDDFARLNFSPDARTTFAPLFAGISRTRVLAGRPVAEGGGGRSVPVIGFCGAPWTLMSYMVGATGGRATPAAPSGAPHGAGKDSAERVRAWLTTWPEESHFLLRALSRVCADVLVGAWAAGASILQVFESGAGDVPPSHFREFCAPYMKEVAARVRARTPPVSAGGPLLISFARGAHCTAALEGMCDSDFDALSLDWGWCPAEASARVKAACAALGKRPLALQGNLDPAALFSPPAELRAAVRQMIRAFGAGTKLVANLGHGMIPSHDPDALGEFFDAVAAESAELSRATSALPDDVANALNDDGGEGAENEVEQRLAAAFGARLTERKCAEGSTGVDTARGLTLPKVAGVLQTGTHGIKVGGRFARPADLG